MHGCMDDVLPSFFLCFSNPSRSKCRSHSLLSPSSALQLPSMCHQPAACEGRRWAAKSVGRLGGRVGNREAAPRRPLFVNRRRALWSALPPLSRERMASLGRWGSAHRTDRVHPFPSPLSLASRQYLHSPASEEKHSNLASAYSARTKKRGGQCTDQSVRRGISRTIRSAPTSMCVRGEGHSHGVKVIVMFLDVSHHRRRIP